VGTIDKNLQPHIHIELSDGSGRSIGGHLPSLDERKSSILLENM
jgi:predicted DNA-binding protein with PD1-like motif